MLIKCLQSPYSIEIWQTEIVMLFAPKAQWTIVHLHSNLALSLSRTLCSYLSRSRGIILNVRRFMSTGNMPTVNTRQWNVFIMHATCCTHYCSAAAIEAIGQPKKSYIYFSIAIYVNNKIVKKRKIVCCNFEWIWVCFFLCFSFIIIGQRNRKQTLLNCWKCTWKRERESTRTRQWQR